MVHTSPKRSPIPVQTATDAGFMRRMPLTTTPRRQPTSVIVDDGYDGQEYKKGSPYSIIERRVPELIPVLGSQPAGDVSHKPGGRLPLLSTRPAVTHAILNRAATSFAAWWTRHDGCEQFA